MSVPIGPVIHDDDEDDYGRVFLKKSDIISEIDLNDDEDLPDADDESDVELAEMPDDSVCMFTEHGGEVYTVSCSPTDPKLVATGGEGIPGFLWKIDQRDWAFELQGHKHPVSSLSFSHDGQLLASGSLDGIVQVWDISRNLKSALEGPTGEIEWLKWHPRGHILLAGSADCCVWMWNADKCAFLKMLAGHGDSVTCGDFTPDGKIICTGSEDATLRIWDPKSGKNIHIVQGHPYHTMGLTCLALSSSSTLALTGSVDGSAHIVNINTGKVVSTPASHSDSIELDFIESDSVESDSVESNSITCVGFAPSGCWAAIGAMDRKLVIWDVEHSLSRSTCVHGGGVTCLSWLGAYFVATGCTDGNVRLWDSRSGECVRIYRGHSDAIQSLSVSANGDCLVSASYDGTARVFEVKGFL